LAPSLLEQLLELPELLSVLSEERPEVSARLRRPELPEQRELLEQRERLQAPALTQRF
jgi:hypothetical protein